MRPTRERLYANATAGEMLWLIDHIAACARALDAAGTADLAARGLDRPTRRLLAELHSGGPRPVPKLAAALGVTRQAVQPIVDALAAAGDAELMPNKAKRRSPFVRLSEAGFRRADDLARRELACAERLAGRFLASHVAVTRRTLANLMFATTGGHAWQLPALRAGYEAPDTIVSLIDEELNRFPTGAAGLGA